MSTSASDAPEDVFLEDLRGERSMEWVKAENERALAAIAGPSGKPEDDPMFAKLRAIYDDKEKIPAVRLRGDFVYNFWQDEHHVKGIWRRTTMDDFKTPTPTWETVLDVDDLASKEGKSWVWKGPSFLDYGPGDDRFRVDRCVVKLSDGGTDACTVREFDVVTKKFVEGPGAFVLPPGKNNFCWVSLFYSRTVWAILLTSCLLILGQSRRRVDRPRFRRRNDEPLGVPADRARVDQRPTAGRERGDLAR